MILVFSNKLNHELLVFRVDDSTRDLFVKNSINGVFVPFWDFFNIFMKGDDVVNKRKEFDDVMRIINDCGTLKEVEDYIISEMAGMRPVPFFHDGTVSDKEFEEIVRK